MLLSPMPIEETSETRVRTDCLNFHVSLCIHIKKQFQSEEEGIGVILYFCGTFDPAAVKDCTKCPSFITNVLLLLVRDVISGVCCQRYEKRLEQEKARLVQMLMFALQKKIWERN